MDPDRWEEEKRAGITIDLGFAHVDLGDNVRIGFIDVPGHERFVKNMLAGVGRDRCGDVWWSPVMSSIKPQTREHFNICRLLGIRQGLVVITKSDLVEPEVLDLVRLEVQEFVAGSFLADAPVVAVSARTGEGLDGLKRELRRLSLWRRLPSPSSCPSGFPFDRSFVMKGFRRGGHRHVDHRDGGKGSDLNFPLGKTRPCARHRGLQCPGGPRRRRPANGL